ncbi:MAG: four helix bundle protein [Calditrichaceae bacterium]|nr:four helix bundle protein [Calditrichaceae bacterium]MBN2708988.1 four helix bundle protein [Calditrichaceae bacterium]RQV93340.1 MAG: four helix bundle protein [Calditrichota bacterium]
MNQILNPKPKYDLEQRTFDFAKDIRLFLKSIPDSIVNREDSKQLIRSSGSVGANYIEANESLSKKDFIFRMKISRKEAKECIYWMKLLIETNGMERHDKAVELLNEIEETRKIMSSIIKNTNV